MAYIVQDDVEKLLGEFTVPAHWTTAMDDAATPLEEAIKKAEETIDSVTANRFELTTRLMQLKGDGTDTMPLTAMTLWPLYTITSITERDSYDDSFSTDGSVVSSDYYEIGVSRRSLINHYGVWTGAKFYNYQLIAIFGYYAVPKAIREAAVLLVQNTITPGHADKFTAFESENFSDGYRYTRTGVAAEQVSVESLTGIGAVDIRLAPYVVRLPRMIGL